MNRGKGLRRTARLHRGKPLRARRGLARKKALARSTAVLPARSARQRQVDAEWSKVKRLAWRRSKGCCEGCGDFTMLAAAHAHHRQLRRAGDHSLANCALLCSPCHDLVHADRAWSSADGLIVSQHDDPSKVPMRLPDGRLVLLGDMYEEVAA